MFNFFKPRKDPKWYPMIQADIVDCSRCKMPTQRTDGLCASCAAGITDNMSYKQKLKAYGKLAKKEGRY